MFDLDHVLAIYAMILKSGRCMQGSPDLAKLAGAFARVENWRLYAGTDDIFEIAALYAVAIARAHALPDGNKRTAFLLMTSFLTTQGFTLNGNTDIVVELMVDVASGKIDQFALAEALRKYCKAIDEE